MSTNIFSTGKYVKRLVGGGKISTGLSERDFMYLKGS